MLRHDDYFFSKNKIGLALTLWAYPLHVVPLIKYKDYILFSKFKNRKILLSEMIYLFPRQEHLTD